MKLLILVIASLLSLSALGEETDTSRSDNIKRFNEAQRCFKEAVDKEGKKSEPSSALSPRLRPVIFCLNLLAPILLD